MRTSSHVSLSVGWVIKSRNCIARLCENNKEREKLWQQKSIEFAAKFVNIFSCSCIHICICTSCTWRKSEKILIEKKKVLESRKTLASPHLCQANAQSLQASSIRTVSPGRQLLIINLVGHNSCSLWLSMSDCRSLSLSHCVAVDMEFLQQKTNHFWGQTNLRLNLVFFEFLFFFLSG